MEWGARQDRVLGLRGLEPESDMRRFLTALLGLLIGYPLFAFAGYWAIALFSNNHFDGSVEASMTAAFVIGPAGAVIGLIAGAILGKSRTVPADTPAR
jgi:hypothetical protein